MIEMSFEQYKQSFGSKSKYGAIKTECRQKHTHDSIKEATRCNELYMLQKSKKISKLVQQPKFVLLKGFKYKNETIRALCYYADFQYKEKDMLVIEDVKGKKTDVYLIKKKLLLNYLKNKNNCKFIET